MSIKEVPKHEDGEVMEPNDEKSQKRLTRTQSTFLKLFDCPVCFERIRPPVTVCINGHAVCQDCRKHLLTCPTCKANFSQYKNTMIDQIIEENLFLCKYSERGCTIELKFHAMEDHEKRFCRHRTLKCVLSKNNEPCEGEVPIWEYYIHVLRNHPQETINFKQETERFIKIDENLTQTNILKNITNQKIILETIRLDRATKKFFIVYQYIGLYDDSLVQFKIYNKNYKYKELIYRNICSPVGTINENLENPDKCLILDMEFLGNFAIDSVLSYTLKVETIPKNWFQVIKDKISNNSRRIVPNPGGSSTRSQSNAEENGDDRL